ncbi:MAG TPA: hypothetical protein VHU81_00730 [Thermoanaerobaculia bacterium]|nr:hypothetical protein [Thermoanaerobaculia bacterium]
MYRTRLPLALLSLLTLALAPAAAQAPKSAATPAPQTFRADVLVREVELILDLPENLQRPGRTGLQPGDVVVTEDGVTRPVTKIGPVVGGFLPGADNRLVEAAAWDVVIYFDALLAAPDNQFLAALALSQRAGDLTRLGNVAIVVADPAPRQVLAPTRITQNVEQALGKISAEARVKRDRAGAGTGRAPRTVPDLQRQSDRLLAQLTAQPSGGPRALFLVADSFDLSPREMNLMTQATGQRSEEAVLAPVNAMFQHTAQTLAGYGWVTVALPMRKTGLGREHNEPNDTERIRQMSGGSSGTNGVPPVIGFGSPDHTPLRYEGVVDAFVQRSTAPLLELAQQTAGTMVAFDEQMRTALDGLSRRWHLYYQAPDPLDGQVRPVEVRLREGALPVRTRRWVRSSTPETVSEARLRLLLGGAPQNGTLPLTVQPDAAAPLQVRLTLPAQTSDPEGGELTPSAQALRVSTAYVKSDGSVEIRHETVATADLAKGWTRAVTLAPPAGARQAAVLVENLGDERWKAEIVKLPASGQAGR